MDLGAAIVLSDVKRNGIARKSHGHPKNERIGTLEHREHRSDFTSDRRAQKAGDRAPLAIPSGRDWSSRVHLMCAGSGQKSGR